MQLMPIHTYGLFLVLVFFLLAFILLLVPSNHSTVLEQSQLPAFEANCWTPPTESFKDFNIQYTNTFCSGYLTSLLRGKADAKENGFRYMATHADEKESKSDSEENEERRFVMGSVRDLGAFYLFILAVCLRLPRMLWSILSECFDNNVNVGRTLQSAEKADLMGYDSRQQKYTGLVKAFIDYTRSGPKTATCLYMVMKIFMIIVIIAEIIVIAVTILPEIHVQEFSWHGPISKLRLHKTLPIYLCPMKIVSTMNSIDYNVQCFLSEGQRAQVTQLSANNPTMPSNIFLIALANLVFLFIINVVNTLLWIVRLAKDSSWNRFGLTKDSPLDFVFMIQMAQANLGIDVAFGLAKSVHGGQYAKGDGEEILLRRPCD